MIAITVTSARPAIESAGIRASRSLAGSKREALSTMLAIGAALLVIDVQPAFAENEPAGRLELVHQSEIVRGDDNGRA